jgi:hypothetical protein
MLNPMSWIASRIATLAPHCPHSPDCRLLGTIGHQHRAFAKLPVGWRFELVAERPVTSEVLALHPHELPRVPDTLADPRPLELRKSSQDGEHQFTDAVAADIAAKVENSKITSAARKHEGHGASSLRMQAKTVCSAS